MDVEHRPAGRGVAVEDRPVAGRRVPAVGRDPMGGSRNRAVAVPAGHPASAAGEMSIAVTGARGNSRASATARQPEPVPTSATLSGAFRRSPSSSTAASTISLPQPLHGTPCSSQKAYSRSRPSTQRTAFRESRA